MVEWLFMQPWDVLTTSNVDVLMFTLLFKHLNHTLVCLHLCWLGCMTALPHSASVCGFFLSVLHAENSPGSGGQWETFTHSGGHQRTADTSLQVNFFKLSSIKNILQLACKYYYNAVINVFVIPIRTLEYLTKHLAHLATLSTTTNMHTRNLALVWAPNLLRWV